DWGLPSQDRLDILLSGIQITDQLRADLNESTEEYFGDRADAERGALKRIEQQSPPTAYRAHPLGPILTQEETFQAFRRYIISSSADDEREPYIALGRMNPAEFDFDPRGFMYGGAYLYPLGALLACMKFVGLFHPDEGIGYFVDHPNDVRNMYLAGRSLSALAFLGVMLVLALLGNRLGGIIAGSFTMLAWGFSTLALNQAILSKPHVWTSFWLLLGVYFLLLAEKGKENRYLFLSGIAMGLGAGSNIFAGLSAAAFGVALIRGERLRSKVGRFVLLITIALITYGITNPYVFINPMMYLATILYHGSREGYGYLVLQLSEGLKCLAEMVFKSYAFPISLVGIMFALKSALFNTRPLKHLSRAWLISLLLLAFTVGVPRILLFLGPVLCLFGGLAVKQLLGSPFFAGWGRRAILVMLILGPGFYSGCLFAHHSIADDAWVEPTKAWIRSVGTDEEIIVGLFGPPEPRNTPPVPFLRSKIINLSKYEGGSHDPEYVLIGSHARDRHAWDAHPLRTQYQLLEVLGYHMSHEWLPFLRTKSQSHAGAWVYVKGIAKASD
ncbi:MAG: hypothetical protein KJ927_19150, partial [Candidatus Eisenbacteria bacterium]|nr:hypothetical protein [Candidatus Eisenbacteria bacterium]